MKEIEITSAIVDVANDYMQVKFFWGAHRNSPVAYKNKGVVTIRGLMDTEELFDINPPERISYLRPTGEMKIQDGKVIRFERTVFYKSIDLHNFMYFNDYRN